MLIISNSELVILRMIIMLRPKVISNIMEYRNECNYFLNNIFKLYFISTVSFSIAGIA